ncbi:MAG: quinolinate synthase NadA [Candidatus Cloacimonetes bacterium]|nr:quinolinate synthase NadA [Candidatus Cloacimonadota bacterium]
MKIEEKIIKLKKEKNAIILAHNYQIVPIQDLADFRGDSLQLSIQAKNSQAPLIVFCGVRFMAETAAILNPKAKVILPAEDAGCPLADMINAEQLRQFKALHPEAKVVCYINSSAEVKAESDVCCTSANAVQIINSFPENETILFVPDKNLGSWAAKQSSRNVIVWNGYCPVHQWGFTHRAYDRLKNQYPDYKMIAHPECDEDIIAVADEVLSTSGMEKYIKAHDKLIIATDSSFSDYMQHLYPEKKLVSLNTRAYCNNMRKITLKNVLRSLEEENYLVQVPAETAKKALSALNKMLEISH